MPYIANEGIRILTNRGLPITVIDTLVSTDATSSDTDYYYFTMATFDTRFKKMIEITLYKDGSPEYAYCDNSATLKIEKTMNAITLIWRQVLKELKLFQMKENKEDAVKAREAAEIKYFKEFRHGN